jgi:hypothetical protein
MTHWYREPKRIKLMEHLERGGIEFVLCSEGFSEGDLRNLQAGLQQVNFAERLTLGPPMAGGDRKVLVTARHGHADPDWLRNPEPWAGIFILPFHRPTRVHALQSLFTMNRAFQNGARGRRAISKGVLHRFILDLRAEPPSLYGVRDDSLIHPATPE